MISSSSICATCSPPCVPIAANPYKNGLPTRTKSAPNARALSISRPDRIPLSKTSGYLGPTAWRIEVEQI